MAHTKSKSLPMQNCVTRKCHIPVTFVWKLTELDGS